MTQDEAFSRRVCVRVLLDELRITKGGPDPVEWPPAVGPAPSRSRPDDKKSGRRNADRRVILPSASADAAARLDLLFLRVRGGQGGARSPVGVPPRRLRQRTNAAAQLQHALPGTWSACTVPMVRKTVRGSTGVTRSFLSQSSELLADRSSCRPGVLPEPPENGSDEPPPAGTALAPAAGVTRRPSCSGARFVAHVSETGTNVNGNVTHPRGAHHPTGIGWVSARRRETHRLSFREPDGGLRRCAPNPPCGLRSLCWMTNGSSLSVLVASANRQPYLGHWRLAGLF
jgi:hypothetical protein